MLASVNSNQSIKCQEHRIIQQGFNAYLVKKESEDIAKFCEDESTMFPTQ